MTLGFWSTLDERNAADLRMGIVHREGVPWYEAPVPRRWHRCVVQTSCERCDERFVIERCACGAIRFVYPLTGPDPWDERNSRKRREFG